MTTVAELAERGEPRTYVGMLVTRSGSRNEVLLQTSLVSNVLFGVQKMVFVLLMTSMETANSNFGNNQP